MGETYLAAVVAKVLRFKEEEDAAGDEAPPPRFDARILDILRELGQHKGRVKRGRGKGLGLADRLVARSALNIKLVSHLAIKLSPCLDEGF